MYEETKQLDPLAAARKRLDFARHQKLLVSMRLAGLGEVCEGEEAELDRNFTQAIKTWRSSG